MKALLRLLWDICRFKRGPQDLPYSKQLMFLLTALNITFTVGQLLLNNAPTVFIYAAFLSFFVSAGYNYTILSYKKLSTRFVQTFSAHMGTAMLFGIAGFIFTNIAMLISSENILFFFGVLYLQAWAIGVAAHIFRHALNTNFLFGLLTALGQIAIYIALATLFIRTS